MKILILGATGKSGRAVTAEALARGHEVVAVVHKTTPAGQPGLHIVHGDVHDAQSIVHALQGCDAVISCLSSWGTPRKDVLASAMRSVIPAMKTTGVRRIVTVTGNIALLPDERVNPLLRLIHSTLVFCAPKVGRDAEDHLAQLAASTLDWTSVRSPVMTNGTAGTYRLTNTVSIMGTIPRKSLATAVIDLVTSDDWVHQAPIIRRA